ncbi:hypothetical protein BH23GEM9_BH23GEM9_04650 [soil metagenome]
MNDTSDVRGRAHMPPAVTRKPFRPATGPGLIPPYVSGLHRPRRGSTAETASEAAAEAVTEPPEFAPTETWMQPETSMETEAFEETASFAETESLAETDIPVTDIPETDVPETDVPETDVPETDVPETDVPETDIPETDIPETDIPETDVPDVPERDVWQLPGSQQLSESTATSESDEAQDHTEPVEASSSVSGDDPQLTSPEFAGTDDETSAPEETLPMFDDEVIGPEGDSPWEEPEPWEKQQTWQPPEAESWSREWEPEAEPGYAEAPFWQASQESVEPSGQEDLSGGESPIEDSAEAESRDVFDAPSDQGSAERPEELSGEDTEDEAAGEFAANAEYGDAPDPAGGENERDRFPMEAFFVPAQAQRVPVGYDEHRHVAERVAVRLEELADNVRRRGLSALGPVSRDEHTNLDELSRLIAAVIAGFFAREE